MLVWGRVADGIPPIKEMMCWTTFRYLHMRMSKNGRILTYGYLSFLSPKGKIENMEGRTFISCPPFRELEWDEWGYLILC